MASLFWEGSYQAKEWFVSGGSQELMADHSCEFEYKGTVSTEENGNITQKKLHDLAKENRNSVYRSIVEQLRLEGTSGDHLTQPSVGKRT